MARKKRAAKIENAPEQKNPSGPIVRHGPERRSRRERRDRRDRLAAIEAALIESGAITEADILRHLVSK
ncbi:MAG: hypothetical protein KF750_14330 [Xanthobacteraceae bacterium]|nr:hypothetical protein [Xanthobacteraceae bacterium]